MLVVGGDVAEVGGVTRESSGLTAAPEEQDVALSAIATTSAAAAAPKACLSRMLGC